MQPTVRVQQAARPTNQTPPAPQASSADVFEDQYHYDVLMGLGAGMTAGAACFLTLTAGALFALPIIGVAGVFFASQVIAHKTLCERDISIVPTWFKRGVAFISNLPTLLSSLDDNGMNKVAIKVRKARPHQSAARLSPISRAV